VLFFGFTTLALLGAMPLILISTPAVRWYSRQWARVVLALARDVAGIRWELRGHTELLKPGVLIASKHQSAWDTVVFFLLFERPTYVMKKELGYVPIYGWLAKSQGHIFVDRKAGAAAIRNLRRLSQAALKAGRSIVIFPQGTRVAPRKPAPYQPGVAGLYMAIAAPVVPVALNSGLFWGRRRYLKHPGTIIVEVLPEIAAGLDRDTFMRELETRIETATTRLESEALAGRT
jgi:1-acyl-sn-glycerol-3-phosphate acyltransferase